MDCVAYYRNKNTDGYRFIRAWWWSAKQEWRWSLWERINGKNKRLRVVKTQAEASAWIGVAAND